MSKVRKEQDSRVTQELLHELYDYDAKVGQLVWTAYNGRCRHVGKSVGSKNKATGYIVTRLFGVSYGVHRLIWLYHYGRWPNNYIDHINGVKTDNRIENLRDTTPAENVRNTFNIKKTNTGYRGVNRVRAVKSAKPYKTGITVDNVIINLGRYETIEDAVAVYHTAREMLGLIPVPVLVS